MTTEEIEAAKWALDIDFDHLAGNIKYDHETGFFSAKTSRKGMPVGKNIALPQSSGYLRVSYKGYRYLAHRLAWIIFYRENPPGQIDHINGDRKDNRIKNLRIALPSENNQNQSKAKGKNKVIGVYLMESGRYQAKIKANGKTKILGRFDSEEEASQAYWSAKMKFHPFCNPERRANLVAMQVDTAPQQE